MKYGARPERTKAYHAKNLALTKNAFNSIVAVERQKGEKIAGLYHDHPTPLRQRDLPAKLHQQCERRFDMI
jgi:hypothetical protein